MAKRERKRAEEAARQQQTASRERLNPIINRREAESDEARARGRESYDAAASGYRTGAEAPTGGMPDAVTDYVRGSQRGIRETGGFGDVSDLTSRIRSAGGEPQGVNQERLDTIRQLQTRGAGGLNPEQLATIRGGYGEFARTGGFTPESAGAFRRRATGGVAQTYQTLADEASRRRAISGGTGFGGGELAQLARQGAQRGAEAATAAEAEIANQTRAGRLAGLGGLSETEQAQAAAMRQGTGQMAQTEIDAARVANEAAAGRRGALGLETGLEEAQAAGRRAGAGMQTDFETNMARNRLTERLQSLGGLENLARLSQEERSDLGRQALTALGMLSGDERADNELLAQLSQAPGLFDNILRAATAAGGVATGVAGVGNAFRPRTITTAAGVR